MATLAEHTVPEGPVQDLDKDAKLPDINLMVTAKDAETFVVDFSECTNSNANLQDAFLKYRKKRQDALKYLRRAHDSMDTSMLSQRRPLGSFPSGNLPPGSTNPQRRSPYSQSERAIKRTVRHPRLPPPPPNHQLSPERRYKDVKNITNEYAKEIYRTKIIKLQGTSELDFSNQHERSDQYHSNNQLIQVRFTDSARTVMSPRILAMRSAYNVKLRENINNLKCSIAPDDDTNDSNSRKQIQYNFKEVQFDLPYDNQHLHQQQQQQHTYPLVPSSSASISSAQPDVTSSPEPANKQIRKSRKKKVLLSPFRSDPARMWELRMKFIEQCKLYFGIPYAKRYWTTEDEHYHSKLFLDCCGLVRRVMRDLKREVGFKIGPWNQAYMFDTLPGNEKIEDMRPGDLVFIQATYYNPKMKKQPHDVTHVEVWLGEGEKTIGARWQKGVVQIFESYRFTASSYHSEKYVFKSIDPWLRGQCKSQCKTHQWKSRAEKFKPPKKSIFNIDDKQNKQQGHNSDSSEGHGNFSKPKTSISRQMNSNTYFKPILPSARKSAKKKKGAKKSVAKGAKKKSANKEGRQKEDGTSSQQQQQQQLHNQQQQQRQEPELDELQPVVSKREESQVSSQPVPLPRKSLLQRPVEAPRAAAHKDRSEIYKVPEPEEDKENFANGGPEPDEEEEENNTREKGDCEEEEEDEDDEDDSEEEEEILEPDEEEESDEDDEEAECEEEQDAEDTVGDSDLGYVGQREQAKNTLPNIFEEGNVNMVTAALPKDVTPLREGSGRITRLSLVHAPSSARPLSARSIIDDDDISVLNLQQEVPNFSLFPAARASKRSAFSDYRVPSVAPPLVDSLASLRQEYMPDDRFVISRGPRPQSTSRARPGLLQRKFMLVGTPAPQSVSRSPRLDIRLRTSHSDFRSRSLIGSTLNFGAVSDLHYGAPYDVDDQGKYGGRGGSGGTSSNQGARL